MKKNILTMCVAVFLLTFSAAIVTSCDSKKEADSSAPAPESAAEGQKAEAEALADIPSANDEELISDEPATNDTYAEETEEVESVVKESIENTPAKNTSSEVYMGMWGYCGGTGFLFDMDGKEGHYRPWDGSKEYGETRQLKLVSYNPKTGKCVINAYLKKKYIGQFDGIFQEAENEDDEGNTHYFQSYDGIFKSVNGSKLDFHFHFD